MSQLTKTQLIKIFPNVTDGRVRDLDAQVVILNKVAFDYDITNERRLSAWLATLGAESAELKYQEEIASGAAYEGRADLGNTQKGDGRRFKGKGRIQITGRSNTQAYTNYLKKNKHLPFIDFIAEPEKLAQEPYATDSAGWFWAIKVKNNTPADKGDFLTTQVRVNGRNKKTGLPNHYDVRQRYYARALSVLPDNFQLTFNNDVSSMIDATNQRIEDRRAEPASDGGRPLLKLGSEGGVVNELHEMLGVDAASLVGQPFGKSTETLVRVFQRRNGLTVDGVVGPATWAALLKDSAAPQNDPNPPRLDIGQQAPEDINNTVGAKVEISAEGGVKAETNQPEFVPEDKTMTAPAKDGAEAKSQTMTILGIAVPSVLVPVIATVKSGFENGYLDAKEILGSLLTFLQSNYKYVFILIAMIIAVMLVKKAFKQLTFLLQMYINARNDMHNVTVRPNDK